MKCVLSIVLLLNLVGCLSVAYNSDGSTPLNQEEVRAYSAQVLRCYKMGGTRIVKIDNVLRCF